MEIGEMIGICYGTWLKKADKKGRIGIPIECREAFANGLIVVENDDSFSIYPIGKIENIPDYSKIMLIHLDRIGRFAIPMTIRRKIFSEDRQDQQHEVIFYGRKDYFEVKLSN